MLSSGLLREVKVAFDEEIKEKTKKIIGLSSQLQTASPVDTGNFRRNWKYSFDVDKVKWTIENVTDYASILYHGRRFVNGRWYGSEQLPNGYEPMIKEFVDDVL